MSSYVGCLLKIKENKEMKVKNVGCLLKIKENKEMKVKKNIKKISA